MKATTNPPVQESSKQRALRIALAYHRRGNTLIRSKYFWAGLGSVCAMVYLGWILLGAEPATQQLSPAPLASVHSALNARCAECHVQSSSLSADGDGVNLLYAMFGHGDSASFSCGKCHQREATNPHHSNQLAAEIASCAACHTEHQGSTAELSRPADRSCTNCHRDIAAHRSSSLFNSPIQDVKHFASSQGSAIHHPPFRSLPETDDNNFKFNHRLHMLPGQWPKDGKPEGAWTPNKISAEFRERYRAAPDSELVQLDCTSCHEPQQSDSGTQSGAYMQPVNFERHCQACHPLQVMNGDKQILNVRHGLKQTEVREVLAGFFAERKPDQTDQTPRQLSPNTPIPGKTPGDNLAQNLNDSSQPEIWQSKLFHESCLKCHTEVPANANESAAITFQKPADFPPPRIRERWLRHAWFDHSAHQAWVSCVDCHAGAYAADESTKPPLDDASVLIPNVDHCVQCHAPQSTHPTFRAAARFDCAECHRYHAAGAP